ncbi:hypothetical protein AHF37_03823 [Paragonimus kellicotti]|nr:hypothetical protein AHF37_03823 [Paragonimus kellicotti]
MPSALPNHTIPEPVKAELDEKDDDDGRSSVQTMSTDPMKDLLFDLIMSPSEDRSTTLSSVSSESLADGHLKMSQFSTRSRKPTGDTSDEESSPSHSDGQTHGENHKEALSIKYNSRFFDLLLQQLQDRMHRILEAWRAAKQYLKDLDHRTNRSRRSRVRHSTSDQPSLQQPPSTAQSSTPMRSQQLTEDSISSSAAPQLLNSTPERTVSVIQSQ